MDKVLVFLVIKKLFDVFFERLEEWYLGRVGVIYFNKVQNNCFNLVNFFKDGIYCILIVIDLIVCGLDIVEVLYVINFDILDELESYIYWIGWMGWVDVEGIVLFFIIEKDIVLIEGIQVLMNYEIFL